MRSMPQALLWETLSRGRWSLPGAFLLGNLVPLLTYGALSKFPYNVQDQEFIVLQYAFLPIVIFQFAIGIVFAQGPVSRLFPAPISTNSIVAWHTISGAAILAAEAIAAAYLYNTLFHVGWPLLGSALFAAAAWSAFQILICISSQQSFLGVFFTGLPGIFLCFWLQTRYGSFMSPPKHYWNEVSPTDFATIVVAFSLCLAMTVFGVRLTRCGERIPTLGVWNWISKLWDNLTTGRLEPARFSSPDQAQFWYEWKLKGIALPIVTAFVLSMAAMFGLGIWLANQSSLSNLYECILFFGGILSLLAIGAGLLLGADINSNPTGQRESQLGDAIDVVSLESLGSFFTIRPLTSIGFSLAILKTAALSSLIAWCIWFAFYIGCLLLMWINQEFSNSLIPPKIGLLYYPLTILGPWIAMSNVAAIGLSGRGSKILLSIIGLFTVSTVLFDAITKLMPSSALAPFYSVCTCVGSALIVLAALGAFVQARRRVHLSDRALVAAGMLSCGIVAAAFVLVPENTPFVAYSLIFAFAALVVLPLASLPLAIAWNRHR